MAATLCRKVLRDAVIPVFVTHSPVLTVATQRWRQPFHTSTPNPTTTSSTTTTTTRQIITTKDIQGFELSSLGPVGNPHPRPVVVLIGWLNAKRKHLYKYQELYWQRGLDVLTMCVSPIHVIRPKTGIKYTAKLLEVLQEHEELNNRPVIFHGFSVGAFIYTQLALMLQQQQQQQHLYSDLQSALQRDLNTQNDLSSRITGLVMDSPAFIDYMCSGIANSVTKNPVGRAVINNSLLMYLAAFPRSVTFHYQESHRIFHHNTVPTLILYSPTDLISSAVTSERYVEEWREKGYPAFMQKFPASSHVNHFRDYPEEYVSALNLFLDKLDLFPSKLEEEREEATSAVKAL